MTPSQITLTVNQLINPATALMVDGHIFTCPTGAEYEIVEAIEVHSVAGTDGSAVTCDLKKAASGVVPGSGTSVLSSTFNLKSTLNVPVSKVRGAGLATSEAVRTIRSGERLCVDLTGTLTALAGFSLTVVLALKRKGTYRA